LAALGFSSNSLPNRLVEFYPCFELGNILPLWQYVPKFETVIKLHRDFVVSSGNVASTVQNVTTACCRQSRGLIDTQMPSAPSPPADHDAVLRERSPQVMRLHQELIYTYKIIFDLVELPSLSAQMKQHNKYST